MNLLGVRLNVAIGPDPVPLPASPDLLEAFQELEVRHSDRERSGFRMSFAIGRSGPADLLESPLVANPLLDVNARVILTVIFDLVPTPIMDGLVTRRDIVPGDEPGTGTLVLTGTDLSVALDREVKQVEHPAQDETVIAAKIAASYPQYGLLPDVRPPLVVDPPIPLDRTPQQTCSDWAYLKKMAGRHGHVVHVDAGPLPGMNRLYWGPPQTLGLPQKALNVNLGPETNVTSMSFGQDALSTRLVEAKVKDRLTGQTVPVLALLPSRLPLGMMPESLTHFGKLRKGPLETSGLNIAQAFARAQAEVDSTSEGGLSASGTLDSLKYNGILRARATVDLRGAGLSFDGTWLVRSVTHRISKANYTQDFTLARGERYPKLPIVRAA